MTNTTPAQSATPPVRIVDFANEAPERRTIHVETGRRETSGPRLQRLLTPLGRVLVSDRRDGDVQYRVARVGIDDHGHVNAWLVRQTQRGTDWKRDAGWLLQDMSGLRAMSARGAAIADDLEFQAAQLSAVWAQVEATLGPLDEAPAVDAQPAPATYRCMVCGEDVPVLDQPAHMDTHEATQPAPATDLDDVERDQARAALSRIAGLAALEGGSQGGLLADLVGTVRDRLADLEARLDQLVRDAVDAADDHGRTRARVVELERDLATQRAGHEAASAQVTRLRNAEREHVIRLVAALVRQRDASQDGLALSPRAIHALQLLAEHAGVRIPDADEALRARAAELDPASAPTPAASGIRDVLEALGLQVQPTVAGHPAQVWEYVNGGEGAPRSRLFGHVVGERLVVSQVRYAPDVPLGRVREYVAAVRAAGFPPPVRRRYLLEQILAG